MADAFDGVLCTAIRLYGYKATRLTLASIIGQDTYILFAYCIRLYAYTVIRLSDSLLRPALAEIYTFDGVLYRAIRLYGHKAIRTYFSVQHWPRYPHSMAYGIRLYCYTAIRL